MGDSGGTLWSMRTKTRQPWWSFLPDDELLQMRLKDLGVSLDGTWLLGSVTTLNGELKRKGLVQAHAWISDEWFSPDTTPGIAIPFYLAHPRLARLERKMFKDVEGGTRRQCMQILRHEAGHIVQHAYALHRRRKWQDMFGRSSTAYPESYRPNPNSKNFVQHLPRWYAQSHPDEDFAETFAVWLTPRSNWKQKYAEWPGAMAKLEYVDTLMSEIAGARSGLTRRLVLTPWAASTRRSPSITHRSWPGTRSTPTHVTTRTCCASSRTSRAMRIARRHLRSCVTTGSPFANPPGAFRAPTRSHSTTRSTF